jgi:hypothetical protein
MRHPARWGSAFAVVAAVLSLAACAGNPAPSSSSIAPSVTVRGRVIPFDDLQRWTLASIPGRDSTRLTVFAVGADRGGGPCGPPVVRLTAEESATTVRIAVADYQEQAGPTTACPAIGYAGGPHSVVLDRSMGDRRIIDASTGKPQALLVAADYPRLVAPEGLRELPFGQVAGGSKATQAWSERGHRAMWLETTTPAASRDVAPYGRIVRRFSIDGSPATVYSTGSGRYAQWQVQWTPNSRQTITLRVDDSAQRRWNTDEVEALARKVTNYRTEATGRLPLPSTPGTTVASYSSADGPVRHAPNMWKSSGIDVGVRCEGAGTVTVSLRGSTYPFACGAGTTQHLVRTDGPPNATFSLDVTATKGVRWTVALARASLDGS